MDRFTTIPVDASTRDQLKRQKESQTYDEFISALLDTYEGSTEVPLNE